MSSRRIRWLLGLAVLHGGCHCFPDHTDAVVSELASHVRDLEPPLPPRPSEEASAPQEEPKKADKKKDEDLPMPRLDQSLPERSKRSKLPELRIPPGLPGTTARALPTELPEDAKERQRVLKELVKEFYPELPSLPAAVVPCPGPEGKPWSLADLQAMALANNPNIRNAIAAVDAAKGAMIQAGAYPNPTIAYEADTVGTVGAGYQGAYFDQPIKGWNKLKLQRAVAGMDWKNAQVALKKAQYDVAYQVRGAYFGVLVAQETMKITRALAIFTNELYRAQLSLVEAGAAGAFYEPMQLRPLVLGARFSLLQAMNQYEASWRQLMAAIGKPGCKPTALTGRVDLPVPVFCHEDVKERMLHRHTDVLTAQNNIARAKYQLEFAQVTPYPDFDVHVLIQKDYTTPPNYLVYSAVLSMPMPLWDQNKGGIMQAQNQLIQAYEGPKIAQLNLITALADAFNRYVTAREQVRINLSQIEDQLRVIPRVYQRYHIQPTQVTFGDVVTAQQTLVTYITTYITALGLQWTAVVDVANLLQTDDLFQMCKTEDVLPVPELEEIFPLPAAGKPGKDPLGTAVRTLLGIPDHSEGPALPPAEPAAIVTAPPAAPDERNKARQTAGH